MTLIGTHDFAGASQFFDRPMKSRKAIIALRETRLRGEAVRKYGKQNREIPDVSNAIDWIISHADTALSEGPGIEAISPNRTNSAARKQDGGDVVKVADIAARSAAGQDS